MSDEIKITAEGKNGDKAQTTIKKSLMDRFMDLIKGNAINPYNKKKLPAQRVYVNVNGDPEKIESQLKKAGFLFKPVYDEKNNRLMIDIYGTDSGYEVPEERLSQKQKPSLPADDKPGTKEEDKRWPEGRPTPNANGEMETKPFYPKDGKNIVNKINAQLEKHGRPIVDPYTGIQFVNGAPYLGPFSFGSAKIEMFSTDREANFIQAREQIAMGRKIEKPKGSGIYRDCTAEDVKKWCQRNKMVLHEEGDGETINKVPKSLHNTTVMYHQGGYSKTKVNANRVFGLNENTSSGKSRGSKKTNKKSRKK